MEKERGRAPLEGTGGSLLSAVAPVGAQEGILPGEAFLTKFSGTSPSDDGTIAIDLAGPVGVAVDLRAPGYPADGRHWFDEPRLFEVTAGDVGQVFGVAFDDASPPNVYLTATSAFGLHRDAANVGWMPGMWGAGGGPGTVYRLTAASGWTRALRRCAPTT